MRGRRPPHFGAAGAGSASQKSLVQTNSPAYSLPAIEEHLVRSRFVAQTFRIQVLLPIRRSDGVEHFPVVYATDGDDFFHGYAALAQHLHLHGETRRFILVGIGYEEPRLAPVLRVRDLYPHAVRKLYDAETRQVAGAPLVGGFGDLGALEATDASEFLRFIREELMPFVERHYRVTPRDNHYMGYSAGGTFGIHTLVSHPETFRTYILGSPATSCDGYNYGLEAVRAFQASGRSMPASVFLSVGELEEFKKGFGRFDLVSGYYLFAKFLKHAAIPGLGLTTRVFPGETHATAWALAFGQGVRALLGPAEAVPFWPEYRK